MKNIVLILLAAMLLFGVACSNAATPPSSEPEPAAPQTPSETTPPAVQIEDFYGEWYGYETGGILTIDRDHIGMEGVVGGNGYWTMELAALEGNVLTVEFFGTLRYENDGAYPQLVGEADTYLTQEALNERIERDCLAVGETAKTERAEITVTKYDFADMLMDGNTNRLFVKERVRETAGEGKTFIMIYFDYTNLDKEKMYVNTGLNVTVEYKDGYQFSITDSNTWVLEDKPNGLYGYGGLVIGSTLLPLTPLESGKYIVCIPVPDAVRSDTASSLRVLFELGKKGRDKDYMGVRFRLDRGTPSNAELNALDKDAVADILVQNTWERTVSASGNTASMTLRADGTGTETYSAGGSSELKWSITVNNIIRITVSLDGGTSTTENKLEYSDGAYVITELKENGFAVTNPEETAWHIKN